MKIYYLLVLLVLFLADCECLNILVLHPLYAGSHVLTLHTLSKELINKGHKITTIRYRDDDLPPLDYGLNHTLIVKSLNNTYGDLPFMTHSDEAQFKLPLSLIWGEGSDIIWTTRQMIFADEILISRACNQILNKDMIDQLKENDYDMAIVDLMYNECGLALAHHLNLPAVGYWAFSFASGPQEFTAQEALPSFVPAMMSYVSTKMTFLERVWNMLAKLVSRTFMYYHASIIDSALERLLPDEQLTSMQLLSNLSGVMINSDFILDYSRPQPPNFINVGGLQIKRKAAIIPSDMLRFIENAEHGVILFTMGFIFNAKAVPHSTIAGLMEVFRRLPQRVIIKLDSEYWKGASPENVMVVPWVPQQSVLAHNNTKLFITHCGMHGVLESIYFRVPMVGMPVFIDQGDVLRRMLDAGIGVGVSKHWTGDQLYQAIVQVRDNEFYQNNINRLSAVFKDKRIHPQDVAVDFLEFVGRTGGAQHLKVQSGHLNFVQYYCVDVLLFLGTIVMTFGYGLVLALKTLIISAKIKTKRD